MKLGNQNSKNLPFRTRIRRAFAQGNCLTVIVSLSLLSAHLSIVWADEHSIKWAEQSETAHTKEFWHSLAKNDYTPPEGASVPDLARSLLGLLTSPDADLRDEIGYRTLWSWIYQKRLLSPDDLRPMITELLENLKVDIGTVGSDAVFRRSFSALVLSVVVARDNAAPFLKETEFRTILASALTYADAEKDLRGYDSEKGWIHSAAHTADLLKFLARGRYTSIQDQAAILGAIARKLRSPSIVFSFGEDERLARAVLSIIARSDFDAEGFQRWLAICKPTPPTAERPSVADLVRNQNLKNALAKLDVLLQTATGESAHIKDAVAALQDILKGSF